MLQTDDVDDRIMDLLRDDGRLSNREVARRLEISEGTVRQRLKKLEDANAIRMGLVVDPVRLGVGIGASVVLSVEPAWLDRTLDAFARLSETQYVASTTGHFNVLISMSAVDMHEMDAAINRVLEKIEGVNRVEVRPMLRIPKHNYQLIAIPPKR